MSLTGEKQDLECLQEPSKMNALVTINNIWNSEEDKECLGKAIYFSFSVYRNICDLDVCFGCLWGKKLPEFFIPKEASMESELLLPLSGSVIQTICSGSRD